MDCPNCGAYNASNSERCRRCNEILPGNEEDESSDSSWGPASGPGSDFESEQRWENHFRRGPDHSGDDEDESAYSSHEPVDPWTTPDPQPTQPADWDIAQSSSPSSWSTSSSGSGSDIPGTYGGGTVSNYLWPAVGVTICCCAPLGIPAIIYASRVDVYMSNGNRTAAEAASDKAKKWILASVAVAVLLWIAIICTGLSTGETTV